MCLIPVSVIRRIGLSLPLFIKWDDAEYGLRARSAGVPTVSLPGAALWHISWLDKDDSLDWQAYFHARNRLVAALIHSPAPKGGRLIQQSGRIDLKHLLSMQYYAAAARAAGIRDVLAGPEGFHAAMPRKLGEVRMLAERFPETRVMPIDDTLPVPVEGKRTYPVEGARAPGGPLLLAWLTKNVIRHALRSPQARNVERPQVEIAKHDATWFRVPAFDSALVSTADGSGVTWYRRDRRTFLRAWIGSVRLHRRLRREWPRLQERYRRHAEELTAVPTWRDTFDGRS